MNFLMKLLFFSPLLTQTEYLGRMLPQDRFMKKGPRKLHCQWSEELIVCIFYNQIKFSNVGAVLLIIFVLTCHVASIYLSVSMFSIFQQVYLLMVRPAVARPTL